MTFMMGLLMGAGLGALSVFVLFAAKVWRRGEEHGRREASRDLSTMASMLTKRVDDLELLRIAREPVPESFFEKAQMEVLAWAETLVKQLKKEQQSPPSPLSSSRQMDPLEEERIQPL